MPYAIKRTYGKTGSDYLHAWCPQRGTSCMGSIKKAMTFDTMAEAEAAAVRAQAECKGSDGTPVTGMTFSVVAIDGSAPTGGRLTALEAAANSPDVPTAAAPRTAPSKLLTFQATTIKRLKRARALAASEITKISVDDLDALLAPLVSHGLLRTTYERCTGATEYRGPSGRIIAASIGSHHFARRMPDFVKTLSMHIQHVGRINLPASQITGGAL